MFIMMFNILFYYMFILNLLGITKSLLTWHIQI
jgi:hypothetical protein